MIHESTVQVMGPFPAFPQSVISQEASQGRVGIAEALQAGPIHRAFIAALPASWRDDPAVEIFSRALWLKEGWYPLTPHFHFDWGGREAASPLVETIMVCVGDISLTEFILGPIEHPENQAPPGKQPGQGMMNRWDGQIDAGIRAGTLRTWRIASETLILFDNLALHRARPASKTGWRVLLRAIRGLGGKDGRNQDSAYGNPGAFTTSRNGFVPETDDQKSRYAAYHA